ncbi:hypothetical protein GC098_28900 [Paenibacillus sp. LMG 31458]|uniref:DUF4760 domain-containing protein n=1 Tax=Paenibacillus phytorum TaxID=2654977 RepID=A0ABX1Y395_9BACL|nr:hypothetical protein [Paenibacillus phytorum]NOU75355.1 hypothetical protein [Paenibacillus phytorum]
MYNYFISLNPTMQAAIVSAIVALVTTILGTLFSISLKSFFDNRSLSYKLKKEYSYEQKKKLRELIGSYQGRVLEAATELHYRLLNLYENEEKGWLANESYYHKSTMYRFLRVLTIVRMFENEAIYIDAQIGNRKDIEFLMFLKALHWICTDVRLFDGVPYNSKYDHFYSDHLRSMCDRFVDDGKVITLEDFEARLKDFSSLSEFFNGMNRLEDRLRWDRIVVLHLILIAFINTIGYDFQKCGSGKVLEVIQNVRHFGILENIPEVIKTLVKQKETKNVIRLTVKFLKKNSIPLNSKTPLSL